jgi:uncharacterized membrane protein YbaN (DUF454 family)
MTNIVGIVISVIIITSFILSIILIFDKIVTSFEKLEKAEKERHDIIIKLIENMGNIHSQK